VIRNRLVVGVLLASLWPACATAVAARSSRDALEHRYRAIPRSFVAAALCVHSGWRYRPVQLGHVRRGDVYLAHAWYRPVYDVPDSIAGGSGEDRWHSGGAFYGGLEWTLGTWREAGGSGSPASARPAEEVYRALVIVRRRGGTWRHDWPLTSRACGLP
jgi:hypothetical protein